MKKIYLTFWVLGGLFWAVCLLSCGDESTAPDIPVAATFERLYDIGSRDAGYAVCQAADGNIVAAGKTAVTYIDTSGDIPDTTVSDDAYVMKVNRRGDTIWTCVVGDPDYSEGGDLIVPALDGGYLMLSETSRYGISHIQFQKILETGETDWSEIHGFGKNDFVGDMITVTDGYILVGSASIPGEGMMMYVIKVNQFGESGWEYTYGPDPSVTASAIAELTDNSLIVAGQGYILVDTVYSLFLMKFSSSGDSLWTTVIDLEGSEHVAKITAPDDSSFILYGDTHAGFGDAFYVLETDSNGKKKSMSLCFLPTDTWIADACISSNGEILIGGRTIIGTSSTSLGYLARISNTGNILWEHQFGDPADRVQFRGTAFLTDGGCAAAGTYHYNINGSEDFYLVRTRADGHIEAD